ncbi:MAG: hypothetical protein M5U09_08265 [Gammaproteobacteria bacterium]|nr:hypothetical protein [Gammaproteobacteria bacterium]
MAGMLNPLYTVLNPVFTDLFLRVSRPELVWRFLYIMPFAITGGVLAAHALVAVFGRVRPIRKAYGFAVTAALVALLFPVKTTFFDSPYSKFYTLAPVAAENDHRNWRDLYAYLNELDRTYSILTDPVTGYTVRALTGHTYHGAKFHTYHWGGYRDFNDPPYELDDFRRYHGWLFVINRRDGGYSRNRASITPLAGRAARGAPVLQGRLWWSSSRRTRRCFGASGNRMPSGSTRSISVVSVRRLSIGPGANV